MSNLSDLLPSGGGQNIVDFTASGTVASGKPVILNANGTVTQVAGDSADQAVGSEVVFESANIVWSGATFDSSNNKVVFVYRDAGNSGYGTAVVGTPASDNSITFGTPVVYNSATSDMNAATFDSSNNKVVIAYDDSGNSNYGTAIVGTVSGTSISFGSEVVFRSSNSNNISATFDSSNNKVVIAFRDASGASGGYGTAIVGTVSGTSISFGTKQAFNSDNTDPISATFDSNSNKVVIAFKDSSGSNDASAVVGTVSGTSISFGSIAQFDSNALSTYASAVFDSSNNKVVISYRQSSNSYGKAVVGTVSGTSISFGSPVTVDSGGAAWQSSTFDSNANKVVLCYRDDGNSYYGTLVVGTVSGTSISFGSEVVFNAASTAYIAPTFDSNLNKVVIGYRDQGNSNYGTGIVFQVAFSSTNLTATNFIGLADAAISNSATGKINVKGSINSKQSSLTIGSDYYVQSDGTVTTTSTSPAVKIGQAVTATTINMMDLT